MNALIGLEGKSELALSSSGIGLPQPGQPHRQQPAIQARRCSGVIRSGGTYFMLFSTRASRSMAKRRGNVP